MSWTKFPPLPLGKVPEVRTRHAGLYQEKGNIKKKHTKYKRTCSRTILFLLFKRDLILKAFSYIFRRVFSLWYKFVTILHRKVCVFRLNLWYGGSKKMTTFFTRYKVLVPSENETWFVFGYRMKSLVLGGRKCSNFGTLADKNSHWIFKKKFGNHLMNNKEQRRYLNKFWNPCSFQIHYKTV